MHKKLLVPLLLCFFTIARAETIKTDVLVIGGTPSGVSSAVQCARSKVKTILVEPGPWLGGNMTMAGICVLNANRNLPSGIWGEFRKRVTDYYQPRLGYDTSRNSILRFEPYTAAEILKKMTDTVKNLTIKINTPWTSVKKDGTGWDVGITINGETVTITTKVLIDATETGDVAAKIGEKFSIGEDSKQETGEAQAPEKASSSIEDITWVAILKDFGRKADKTIAKPESYDPAQYSCLNAGYVELLLQACKIPNDKYMISWDGCGNLFPVTAGDFEPEHREKVYRQAKLHTLGLVFYLQTQLGYKNLGLDDQFNTADHLPPIPYIREYRRVNGMVRLNLNDVLTPYGKGSKLYRTSIAVSDAIPDRYTPIDGAPGQSPIIRLRSFTPYSIPMGAVVVRDQDNLLVTGTAMSVTHLVNASTADPAVQMCVGQGAGVIAAYCAFFKTTTKNLKVRVIQGELLDHKGYLLPITDIPQSDPNFRAVQQVCASGLLQGIQKKNGNVITVNFEPNDTVKTAEVAPVMNELYTRAFLWFAREKPDEKFTIGNLTSFISDYTLTDPATLEPMLQKAWKAKFKLPGEFDLKRPITRLEFAVLANRYLNPFSKRVDLDGRFVN